MTIETAHPTILDRDSAPGQIRQHFSETMALLREVVNYGSNLIPRAFVSSDRETVDIVVIGVLLKHAVTMLDAIEILVSQGAIFAAHLQARSLFETRLYLTWILEKDTIRRANQYFVWHKREEAMWAKRSIPGTPEYSRFRKACDSILNDGKVTELEQEAKEQLGALDETLSSPDYADIVKEFDRLKKPDKDHDVAWYRPWGPITIADMAGRLGLSGEYMIFYHIFSKATHCQEFRRHISIDGKVLNFQSIRHIEGIDTLLRVCISYALDIYRRVLERYRPAELENFSRKYLNEWRDRFHSIRGVKYNVTKSGEVI